MSDSKPPQVCQEPGANCVALATRGDRCAVHGANLRRVDGSNELWCQRCGRKLREGEWYQKVNGRYFHAKTCKAREQSA
jgi:hypothetical protein